jgi:stage II sporulation protein GA (sporulation sigma-E factor processing peptidase)
VVVYADLIFLTNLLIDGAILVVTARILAVRAKMWRIAAAAALGAAYVVLMIVPSLSFLFTFLIKCLFSVIMAAIAFGYGGPRRFLRVLGMFYAVNCAVAGGIFALHFVLQSSGEVLNGIMVTRTGGLAFQVQVPFLFIALVFVPLLLLAKSAFNLVKRRGQITQSLAKVRIRIDDHESECTGLIDTGNQLYDPLTKTPVMVVEASHWEHIFPEKWMRKIRQSEVDQLVAAIGTEPFIWQDRLRLIPYRGVNRGTQFMLALKPDKVVIVHNETEIVNEKVLVGLDGGKLCADGTYQAIVHPMMIGSDL